MGESNDSRQQGAATSAETGSGRTVEPASASAGSDGKGTWHRVRQGDCVVGIAYDNGLLPDHVWDHRQNQELKRRRADRNVLLPGDRVYVPNKRPKVESIATGAQHTYRKKGTPERFQLQMMRNGQPRAGIPYLLDIPGAKPRQGTTDGDGWIRASIPPNAKKGTLTLRDEQDEVYELLLGHLDPKDDLAGVQKRLMNLGYFTGEPDGKTSPETEQALRTYQGANGLSVTGKADEDTIKALKNDHYS